MTEPGIIYHRVSTKEQGEKLGLESQDRVCRDYAAKNDIEIVGIFTDKDVSGTVPFEERPGGKAVLEALKTGKAGILIVYKLDRLCRPPEESASDDTDENSIDLLIACRSLKRNGAKIHAVYDGGLVTFDMLGNIKLLLSGNKAKGERRDIRIRTSDGRRTKAAKNIWIGCGQTPYGYVKIGKREEATLQIDPVRARWVQEIFRLYVEEGLSLHSIAHELDIRNAPQGHYNETRPRAFWSTTTVRWMLTNPVYKGVIIYKTHDPQTGDYDPIEVKLPEDLWIVSQETWEAAQRRVEINVMLQRRRQKHEYLLSGFLRCTGCGSTMGGHIDIRRADRSYHCNNQNKPKWYFRCPNAEIKLKADKAEREVWDWLTRLLTNRENLMLGLDRLANRSKSETDEKRAQLIDLTSEAAKYEAKIRKASAELLMHDNEIVLSALRSEIKFQADYHKSLLSKIARLQAEIERVSVSDDVRRKILAMADGLAPRMSNADYRGKREIMAFLNTILEYHVEGRRRFIKISCELKPEGDTIEIGIFLRS
jgi:site-specific DNA recombinase